MRRRFSRHSCGVLTGGRSTDEGSQVPLKFYREARAEGGFETGIEMALRALLVNPQFVFRIEKDPPNAGAEAGVSHQRSGPGIAIVLFPVEQHSRR